MVREVDHKGEKVGIFGRLKEKIGFLKKKPEDEKKQPNSVLPAPLPPPPLPKMTAPPMQKPEENIHKETSTLKTSTESEANGIKLPVKRHIIKKLEDPFSKKDKSRIFAENLDLIELFKKGEFSEKEILRRQRSAIKARLEKKRIDPGAAKGLLNDYGYYFRKELEEAKNVREERRKETAAE